MSEKKLDLLNSLYSFVSVVMRRHKSNLKKIIDGDRYFFLQELPNRCLRILPRLFFIYGGMNG